MTVLSDAVDELRVIVEPVRMSWERFFKILGLSLRQLRLASALAFEHDLRRRHSLSRRLDQVNIELEGMK